MSFMTIQTSPDYTIVVLTLSTDSPPFCIIAKSESEDKAKEEAMKQAFNKIKNWIE